MAIINKKVWMEYFEIISGKKKLELRLADFLAFLKQNYDGKHIAIVAHKAPQLSLDVLLNGKAWKQALAEDWRKTKAWRPGWEYHLKIKNTLPPTTTARHFLNTK